MIIRTLVRALFLLAVPMAITMAASTAHALSCGDRLVTQGDSATYVRAVCGEPTSLISNAGYPPPAAWGRFATRSAIVETWVYDFGPERFMEELTFVNGILMNDRTLGMGTDHGAQVIAERQREERRARRREE
jgi:hypothetical protein